MPQTQEARRTTIAVGAIVGLVVVCAAVAGPWKPTTRPLGTGRLEVDVTDRATLDTATSPPLETVHSTIHVPAWAPFLLGLLILAVLARVLVPVLRRLLAAGRSDPPGVTENYGGTDVLQAGLPATPALEEGVAAATRLLDDERVPPGDAVVAAWVALEDAAARSGVARTSAQTASEFTVHVLDATQADPGATRRLLNLYLAARFSEHVLQRDDVRAARAALVVLADGVAHLRDAEVEA